MDKWDKEAALGRIVARQHGLHTGAQALSVGFSKQAQHRRVRSGRVEREVHGIFRDTSHPRTFHQRVLAACLSLGSRAAASHTTGGWLYGVRHCRPGNVHVTIPKGATHTSRKAIVHQMAGLRRGDTRLVDGIPVLSPEVLLITLAAVLTPDQLEDAFVDMLCRPLTTYTRVEATLNRLGRSGRNGTAALRKVLVRWSGRSLPGSIKALELGRLLVREHGFPEPVYEFPVECDGFTIHADIGWDGVDVGVEYNSDAHHSTLQEQRTDARRTKYAKIAGYELVPANQEDIDDGGALLSRALRAAAPGAF
jgi:hypothetical protein